MDNLILFITLYIHATYDTKTLIQVWLTSAKEPMIQHHCSMLTSNATGVSAVLTDTSIIDKAVALHTSVTQCYYCSVADQTFKSTTMGPENFTNTEQLQEKA